MDEWANTTIAYPRKGDFSGAKVNKKVSLTKNWRKNIGYSIFSRFLYCWGKQEWGFTP